MKTKSVVIGQEYWTRVGAERVRVRVDRAGSESVFRYDRYSGQSERRARPIFYVINKKTGRELKRTAARLSQSKYPDTSPSPSPSPSCAPATPNVYSHESIIGHVMIGTEPVEKAATRAAILSAVQRAMVCRCGTILDASTACMVEREGEFRAILCPKCGKAVNQCIKEHAPESDAWRVFSNNTI